LVPLLRESPVVDLRLHASLHDPAEASIVHVGPSTAYASLVPHAFVADWTGDGTPAAAYGTQLAQPGGAIGCIRLGYRRRMVRREGRRRLRFLPLHLAMEGYLGLHFGGPSIAWEEWTRQAVTQGLSPRVELTYAGAQIPDLAEALRIFEIYPEQCGVLLYVADALAAAFVVPHPDDYRTLHPTLLGDFYGELLYQYGSLYPPVQDFVTRIDEAAVTTVADLRAQLVAARREWTAFHDTMAGGLVTASGRTVTEIRTMGRFTLSRFLPAFDPDVENHIGETITDEAGHLAYLMTVRLSAAQTRRGYLLSRLASLDWDLDTTAADLGTDREGLVQRLDRAGLGHLLRADVIDAVRRRARR
jgi:hypothetical protein